MWTRWIDELRPENVRPRELARRARRAVSQARGEGLTRLWSLQADALERVEEVLKDAPELPVLSRVADVAERVVHSRLESVTACPIPDYDALNAKKVRGHLPDLDRLALARLRRFEAAHKNRKSVLADIDAEIARRTRPGDDVEIVDGAAEHGGEHAAPAK